MHKPLQCHECKRLSCVPKGRILYASGGYSGIHPPWHFSYFVALQPVIKIDVFIQPPKSQYFVEPPFAAITAAGILGHVALI